jgi:hypothetical protein
VWIDTTRGAKAISYLRSMARLNVMEEFHAHRMAERKRDAYFIIRQEMDHEQDKEK